MKKKCIVLLSGGIDSATVLYMAVERGYRAYAITFDYGQKNRAEIESAARIAVSAGVKDHRVFRIAPELFGASPLVTGSPGRGGAGKATGAAAPPTYVPGRNTLFLAFALCRAEVIGAERIYFGANTVDFSGYPDCTGEFIDAFNRLADKCLAACKVKVEAPLLNFKKSEIIKKGIELGVDYSMTNSCYFPDESGKHCGVCRSCIIRLKGFADAGFAPPERGEK